MEDLEVVKKFMREHDIPEERINFSEMRIGQLRYEMEIFGRRIGGSSFPPERQYEVGERAAEYWRKLSKNSKTFKVLDVGCGEGYSLYFLEKAGIEPYGLNLSVVETELASHGIPDTPTKIMKWSASAKRNVKHGSATNMPFENEFFEGVGCQGVLMMTPHSEKIFGGTRKPIDVCRNICNEFYRVLKHDGHLRLIRMSKNEEPCGERTEDYIAFGREGYVVYDKESSIVERGNVGIEELLTSAGFEISNVEEKSGWWHCKAYKP